MIKKKIKTNFCSPTEDYEGTWEFFPESKLVTQGPSFNYGHLLGGLTVYNEKMMIIAGYNWFVEILENNEWILQEEKLGEIINSFSTVNFENSIYVIGGYSLLAQVQ